MTPCLELVNISPSESFRVRAHGYPFHTVRWHFHPEYEIHLVTDTCGNFFVGDAIGRFAPNNLMMTGPNLPHNWVSDVPDGVTIPRRTIVILFSQHFIEGCMTTFSELNGFAALLQECRRGVLFSPAVALLARPVMETLVAATGVERAALLLRVFEILMSDTQRSMLASSSYLPDPSGYMSAGMNRALTHVREHLSGELEEAALADVAGMTVGGFSRAFKRSTGMTFVRYVNRLRINTACQMLMREPLTVAEICYQVGFNNISNFNRQFLVQKGMSPSRFRALAQQNAASQMAA